MQPNKGDCTDSANKNISCINMHYEWHNMHSCLHLYHVKGKIIKEGAPDIKKEVVISS